ncbi:MAG TPA: hypothetical protein H9781_04825, partial [Candidatus Oscillibacter excrementavium]|nr:hypothetical protein [Candidatus Oscillibacter excrementavium]
LAFSRTLKSSGKRLIENERHPSWVSFVAIFLPVFPDFRVSRQPEAGAFAPAFLLDEETPFRREHFGAPRRV